MEALFDEVTGSRTRRARTRDNVFTIVSNSRSAIRAIASPTSRSDQHVVHHTLNQVKELRKQRANVQLLWVPGRAGEEGNGRINRLAK